LKTVDYIIVGQGIAGSILGYLLEAEGLNLIIIDNVHKTSSSQVGAGIINPITGRNYLLAWEYALHLQEAFPLYKRIEGEIQKPILIRRNIVRTLFNSKDINNWQARLNQEAYQPYILENASLGDYELLLARQLQYGEVTEAYQLNMPLLVDYLTKKWERSGQLLEEEFDHSKVVLTSENVQYEEVVAKGLIFCEGQQVKANPFFDYLPIGDSKGEILKVRIPGVRTTKMIKQRRFIVPLKEDEFWFGSYDRWGALTGETTEEGNSKLVDELSNMINRPFEVISHEAALRPTTPDRRPLLGNHPKYERLYIFNGLGTKGASLAPRWANTMVNFLLGKNMLPPHVDVNRFVDMAEQARS